MAECLMRILHIPGAGLLPGAKWVPGRKLTPPRSCVGPSERQPASFAPGAARRETFQRKESCLDRGTIESSRSGNRLGACNCQFPDRLLGLNPIALSKSPSSSGISQGDQGRSPRGPYFIEGRNVSMKQIMLARMAYVAVALTFPVVVTAQDLSQEPSNSTDSAASPTRESQQKLGNFSTGVMVEDGAAYVIHRLQSEMSLPNGFKIQPDGTVMKADGTMQSMDRGKILSLDGRVMEGPFAGELGTNTTTPDGGSLSPGSSSGTGPETSVTPSSGVAVPESGDPFTNPISQDSLGVENSDLNSSESLTPGSDLGVSSSELSPDYTD
jgi:hypothetical protein